MKSQSVVVSGESGAGKTETCKLLMKFIATVAGSESSSDQMTESNAGKMDNLEKKILEVRAHQLFHSSVQGKSYSGELWKC